MEKAMADDYTSGTRNPGAVEVGGSATGRINSWGDRDWFAVTLEAGKTYRFDLEGTPTGAGTLNDPWIRGVYRGVNDQHAVLLAGTANDDGGVGRNSKVVFSPTETGLYYVAAGAGGSRTGTYKLSVTDISSTDDFAAATDTAGVVEVGGTATGKIGAANDRDWFAVTLEAGKTYRIDLEGKWTGGGTLVDPYLRGVHGADGVLIAGTANNNGGEGANSRVTLTAEADGTYYVAAGAHEGRRGTYTLSVTEVTDADDFGAWTGTGGTAAVGGSTTGEIDYSGDRDWFAVTLEAGRTYLIDLEGAGAGAGTLDDPYLRGIHGSNGALITGTANDNGGVGADSRLRFTAPEAGTYYIEAGAHEGRAGTYTLSVTDVTDLDDYAAGTETTGAVVVGGSATGEVETAGDQDWFAVTLEAGRTYRIDLEGSPTGKGTLGDTYLRGVLDATGALIAGTTDDQGGTGNNSRLKFTASETGTHYVAAGAYQEQTGTYTLSVTDATDKDDHAAGTVAVGDSATGRIDAPGDRDWFAVELEAGRTYQIDMRGTWTGGGLLPNPVLHGVHDADRVFIAGTANDDGGEGYDSRVEFTPEETGTYYVAAGGAGSRTGTYTLSVTDVTVADNTGPPDDYVAGTETTGAVKVGGLARGEIEATADRDWFVVTLEAGKEYRIDLKGLASGHGTLKNPCIYGIHDADGVLIAGTVNNDGGGGHNSRVVFAPEETGTYYVAAGAWGSRTGTYTLSVTEPADDYAAGKETTGVVAIDGSTTGMIETNGDRDWFAVTLEAGRTYLIDLKGSPTGSGTLGDPYLRGIHDENGVRIADTTNDDGGVGRNSRVTFTASETGTYYVAAGAYAANKGTYTLSVRERPGDYPAGTETTGKVMVGGSVTSKLETPGDRDWFAVTLEAGRTYRIDLEGSPTESGTLSDPYLRGIHDENGVRIAGTTDDDDGVGRNSRVTFTASETGTHYVAAGAYGSHTGTYTLSVRDVTVGGDSGSPRQESVPDDFPAGTETTGAVTVGGFTSGEIEVASDQDWFAVTLEAGRTYQLDLKGTVTGDGTLDNPSLYGVHGADGGLIAGTTDDDGGEGANSRLTFTASAAGIHYVAAGAAGTGTGTYTLSVTDVTPPDDYAAGTDTTGAVTVGGSATGAVEVASDRDWFAVTLEAGRTYQLDLEGSGSGDGTLVDPSLHGIHGADGALIAGTADDNGGEGANSRLTFTATAAGTYYVSAGASGSGTGTYTLSVADVTPDDFAAGTDTTGAVVVGGSAAGEVEAPSDRDWFAVTLEAGRTYQLDLEGAGSGALSDPYLHGLHGTDGALIAGTADDDGGEGSNSRVTFTATAAGTHYVSAGASGTGTGTYTLSVTDVTPPPPPQDDFSAGTDTTGAVAVGGSTAGAVEVASDHDWYAVTLEAGRSYRIGVEGAPSGSGTLGDPFLYGIHDTDGALIADTRNNNGGVGRDSLTVFTATEDGIHYVAAGAHGSGTGTYEVSVADVTDQDDFGAWTGTEGTVAVGGSATGRVEFARDRDWFAVTLEAGKEYRIDLEGKPTGAGTAKNPYLWGVHDGSGVLIDGTTDNNGGQGNNSRVEFTASEAGTYYVAAGAAGSSTGTYTLSVEEVM